MIGLKIKKL